MQSIIPLTAVQIKEVDIIVSAREHFVKQKIQVSEMAQRIAMIKNRFQTSEFSRSHQNKQRKRKTMIGCVGSVKSIIKALKSLCLDQNCMFCFTKFAATRSITKYFLFAILVQAGVLQK